MADERRFDDDEVALILEQASQVSAQRHEHELVERAPGLSLAQLQQIAAESGIAPDDVARAAANVARGGIAPMQVRRTLGVPVALGKTVLLARPLTDAEWDRIVVVLRETFEARGTVRAEGTLREWSNGNLRVVLEPTPNGQRLRLSTRRGDAGLWAAVGAGSAALGATLAATAWMSGAAEALMSALPVLGVGLAMLARNAVLLPRWARQRSAQLDAVAAAADRVIEESDASKR
ncbi:MAG: hypothetical protein K2X99_12285 [Gemmatimonadaceae bacterium]|nr:hypothetical protein [Gemmatimonadaceae bacterium]